MLMKTDSESETESLFHKITAVDDLCAAECSARADRLVLLAEIDDSRPWSRTAMHRCPAAVEDAHGPTVGIGRVSRSVPPWLRRKILEHDRGCVFPGCERTRWVHIHHIKHWPDGGPTDLDNLVPLARSITVSSTKRIQVIPTMRSPGSGPTSRITLRSPRCGPVLSTPDVRRGQQPAGIPRRPLGG